MHSNLLLRHDTAVFCMQDIGSGNCAVHNTLLLDHVQKSVVWAPWRYRPPPFWEPFNRNVSAKKLWRRVEGHSNCATLHQLLT